MGERMSNHTHSNNSVIPAKAGIQLAYPHEMREVICVKKFQQDTTAYLTELQTGSQFFHLQSRQ